jgi:hypothetical protein
MPMIVDPATPDQGMIFIRCRRVRGDLPTSAGITIVDAAITFR